MKTISVFSLKGGVGKTTTALSVANILSDSSRVLMIDLDPRTAATSHVVSDPDLLENRTIHQALLGNCEMAGCVHPVRSGFFSFCGSEIELSLLGIEMANYPNKEMALFELLREVEEDFDYCVIDTPNDLGLIANLAVIASDLVIFPTKPEKWAARAVSTSLNGIAPCRRVSRYTGKSFESRVLVVDFEENRDIQNIMLETVRTTFPALVCQSVIHHSVDVTRAYAQTGERLPERSRPAREYQALVSELRAGGLL